MQPSRFSASSGWVPASILALAAWVVVTAYGTPILEGAIFGAYVTFGIAVPGMFWVRWLRGRSAHIAEDLTLGLAAGYGLEIATYLVVRAAGAPLLVLLWPALTLLAFAAVPGWRRYWRSDGTRAPAWWSWSLAAMLGYLLVFSAGTFFGQHHLTGTDTPYVDMPYHLALIGELRHHVPPSIPWVTGLPLAYHWFYYAEAAATSWATDIEPVTLLYRLSGLPMLVAFVVLTATAARRLTGGWWTGPLAVAVALFGTVAGPYLWAGAPVFDTQTLGVTWISPTNMFGLALFAAAIVLFIDLVKPEARIRGRGWVLIGLLAFGLAGAKASLLPLLIVGLLVVIGGVAIRDRRLHLNAAAALVLAVVALILAVILLFRGSTGGLAVGLDSLRALPVVGLAGAQGAGGLASVVLPVAGVLIALLLWSCLWAGAYGLLSRRMAVLDDPGILLVLGICAGALGAVIVFSYPSLSQVYYLKGATGAFGLITAAGMVAIVPARVGPRLVGAVAAVAVVGAVAVVVVRALGPRAAPRLGDVHLAGVLGAIWLPVLALLAVGLVGWLLISKLVRPREELHAATPLLVVALVMGFGLPATLSLLASPFAAAATGGDVVPGDGIAAARWLRDHSTPDDLVATNLHCRAPIAASGPCDARHFWISAYSERRVLVEGWAYTQMAITRSIELGVGASVVPFWDPRLLAQNDLAFSDPTAATVAVLQTAYGVQWLFADVATADATALGRVADLRDRIGDYAVYELRRP